MKHWTLRILLCLFLGAITTVAVACLRWLLDNFPYWGENSLELEPILWFPIDIAVGTLLWLGMIVAFETLRAEMRMERGRCPRCGYDLRGNLDAGCSECGWQRP